MQQGLSFVDERGRVKKLVADFNSRYEFFLNKGTGWLTIWERGADKNALRFTVKEPGKIAAIVARADRVASTLKINKNDWITYEIVSHFLQEPNS
jgi:hypothetical protein